MPNHPRALRTATSLGILCLLAAGCSSTETPSGGGATLPAGQVKTLNVAYNPAAQFAPMFVAMDAGIFEKHGVKLNITPITDVASIVSGVASGQYDLGFATVVNVIVADANGIPIKVVSTVDGQQTSKETDTQGNALLAGPKTDIKTVADLKGKSVAVVGLQGLNALGLQQLLDSAGVDVKSVKLVQLPFGQMADALANGSVQAGVVQSPFIADALSKGSTVIAKPNIQLFADAAVGVFVTSQKFIDSDAAAVKAFHDGEKEGQAYAAAHVDEARQTLVKYLKLTPEAAAAATWCTTCNPDVNTKGLALVQTALQKFGNVNDTTPVDQLVWPGALTK